MHHRKSDYGSTQSKNNVEVTTMPKGLTMLIAVDMPILLSIASTSIHTYLYSAIHSGEVIPEMQFILNVMDKEMFHNVLKGNCSPPEIYF